MNVSAWIKLLLVFHHCIPAPKQGARWHAGSLAAWMNQRIRDFRSNPLITPRGCYHSDGNNRPGVKRDERARLATAMAERIEDGEVGDVKGAIRLASSNDTIALNTPETVERLRSKHPSRPANRRDQAPPLSSHPDPCTPPGGPPTTRCVLPVRQRWRPRWYAPQDP